MLYRTRCFYIHPIFPVLLDPGQLPVPVHRPGPDYPAGAVAGARGAGPAADGAVPAGVAGRTRQHTAARHASHPRASNAAGDSVFAAVAGLVSTISQITLLP